MSSTKRLFSFLFFCLNIAAIYQNSNSQYIDNYRAMMPYYNSSTGIGQTLGGATVALPDSTPVIFHNPANLAQLRHIKGFLSVHYSRGYLDPVAPPDPSSDPYRWIDGLNLGTAALSLPFKLFRLKWTVAGSYTNAIPYDFKVGDHYRQSNEAHSASMGFAVQPLARFRIGVGGTHWSGKYSATTSDIIYELNWSKKTSNYSGNRYYIGMQNDFAQRFALGVVYYFPYQLYGESKTTYSDQEAEFKIKDKQKIPGALRIGLGYRFSSNGTLGAGYGYEWSHGHNSGVSSISAGIEYIFRFNTISLPLYVMYQTRSEPANMGENILVSSEDKVRSHILGFGGGIQLDFFTVYFASQWRAVHMFCKLDYRRLLSHEWLI